MSDIVKALLLGIVEGLTEFLPVSSTGHLILAADALKFNIGNVEAFEVFIQLGAILAVVVLYWGRFLSLVDGIFSSVSWKEAFSLSKVGFSGPQGLVCLAAISLPALIVGGLFHKALKQLFFPLPVAVALILGGIVFFIVEKKKPLTIVLSLDQLTPRLCFIIGIFQAGALWPGISRSGAALVGAMLLGVDRKAAADLSFLAAVPLIAAAALLDFTKVYSTLSSADLQLFFLGFLVSFFAGVASIKLLIGAMKRFSLVPFGVYRITLGGIVLALLF